MLQASVDTEAEALEARSLGWRTFRVRLPGEPLLAFESDCESVSGAQCIDCLGCHGGRSPCRSIEIHGCRSRRYVEFRAAEQLTPAGL
jgi:hypothetical protein